MFRNNTKDNLNEITEATKNFLADNFTVYYLEPVSKDKMMTAKKFQKCVDYYLNYKKVDKSPMAFCSRSQSDEERKIALRNYWLRYFDFLLDNPTTVQSINQKIQEDKPIKVGENLGFIRMFFITMMMKTINEQ
ncbi:hypothetical protein [Lactobacillus paragasseri]|nr:hypothetical protein [Lactobacillus paragasseri]